MDALGLISAAAIGIVCLASLGYSLGVWLGIPFLKRFSDRAETRKRNAKKRHSIRFDDERVDVVNLHIVNAQPIHIQWSAMERLTVFKRDLFTVDLICLVIELKDGRCFELDEDMDGWNPFIDAIPAHLPGCKKFHEWFLEVAVPAFATNSTEIFRRAAMVE